MFRRIFWINLGLFAIVFLLGLNVYKTWFSVIKGEWKEPVFVSAENIPENEAMFGEEKASKSALYTYDVIADKNLFRPERTEWLPPPPDEEESKKKEKSKSTKSNQKALKEPILYGIMIRRDKKSALMKGSIREKAKERFREVRLGNGQVRKVPLPSRPGRVVPDKVRTYHVGDEINESIVVDILQDRVILSKNDEEYEILLREPSRLAAKNAPGPDQESPDKRQMGLQTFPFPGQFPNFPQPPGYPVPPGFPAYQPPPQQGQRQGQRQAGQSRFNYLPGSIPGGGGMLVPPQRRLPQNPGPRVHTPGSQNQTQGSSPYPSYSGPKYFNPNWQGQSPFPLNR